MIGFWYQSVSIGDRGGDDMQTTPVSLQLPTFDLSYVVEQLARKDEFRTWTPERFSNAVLDYQRYLALCKHIPGEMFAPSMDADEIWHRHMLNSRRYTADCNAYFGYYLHHEPSEVHPTKEQRATERRRMAQIYVEAFGEKQTGDLACCSSCGSGCSSSCGGAGSNP